MWTFIVAAVFLLLIIIGSIALIIDNSKNLRDKLGITKNSKDLPVTDREHRMKLFWLAVMITSSMPLPYILIWIINGLDTSESTKTIISRCILGIILMIVAVSGYRKAAYIGHREDREKGIE